MTVATWEPVRRADIRPEYERARRALKSELAALAPREAAARVTALAAMLDQRVESVKVGLLAASLAWNDDYEALVAWISAEHRELCAMAQATTARASERDGEVGTLLMPAAALHHWGEATKWDLRRGTRDLQPIHSLLAAALPEGGERRPVRMMAAGRERNVTLESLYVRALLLDRFAGGSLTRSQLEILDAWLWEWTPALRLSRQAPEGPAFHVDLLSNGALRQGAGASGPGILFLPVQALVECRRHVVARLHRGQLVPQNGCAAEMRLEEHVAVLEQTARAFEAAGGSQTRAERRQEAKLRVETWVGLEEIVAVATNPRAAAGPADDPSRRYLWLNDASGTGFGFEALTSDAEGIEVGDLLGWRKSPDEPVSIGRVARRMPGSSAGQVYFGVELLSADARALMLVEVICDRTLPDRPFIYVAGDQESGRRDACLLPEGKYRASTVFHARVAERTFLLRIGRPSQRGRGWVLASFEVVVPEFTPVERLPEDASWRGVQVPADEVDALDEALAREVGARLLD
jgi:hypothetical protein